MARWDPTSHDSMGNHRKSNGDLTWEVDELKTPKIYGILVMINIVWYTLLYNYF